MIITIYDCDDDVYDEHNNDNTDAIIIIFAVAHFDSSVSSTMAATCPRRFRLKNGFYKFVVCLLGRTSCRSQAKMIVVVVKRNHVTVTNRCILMINRYHVVWASLLRSSDRKWAGARSCQPMATYMDYPRRYLQQALPRRFRDASDAQRPETQSVKEQRALFQLALDVLEWHFLGDHPPFGEIYREVVIFFWRGANPWDYTCRTCCICSKSLVFQTSSYMFDPHLGCCQWSCLWSWWWGWWWWCWCRCRCRKKIMKHDC